MVTKWTVELCSPVTLMNDGMVHHHVVTVSPKTVVIKVVHYYGSGVENRIVQRVLAVLRDP